MDPTWNYIRTHRSSFDRPTEPLVDLHPYPKVGKAIDESERKAAPPKSAVDWSRWPRTVLASPGALTLANLDALLRFSGAWGGLAEERSSGSLRVIHLGPRISDTVDYLLFRRPEVKLVALGQDGPSVDSDLRQVTWSTPEELPAKVAARYGAAEEGGLADSDIKTVPETLGSAPLPDLLEYWIHSQYVEGADLIIATESTLLSVALGHLADLGSVVCRVSPDDAVEVARQLAQRQPRIMILMRPVLDGLYLVALGLRGKGKGKGKEKDVDAWVQGRLAEIAAEQYPTDVDWSRLLPYWGLSEVIDVDHRSRWPGGGFDLLRRL